MWYQNPTISSIICLTYGRVGCNSTSLFSIMAYNKTYIYGKGRRRLAKEKEGPNEPRKTCSAWTVKTVFDSYCGWRQIILGSIRPIYLFLQNSHTHKTQIKSSYANFSVHVFLCSICEHICTGIKVMGMHMGILTRIFFIPYLSWPTNHMYQIMGGVHQMLSKWNPH